MFGKGQYIVIIINYAKFGSAIKSGFQTFKYFYFVFYLLKKSFNVFQVDLQ